MSAKQILSKSYICKECRKSISIDEEYLHNGEEFLHLKCYTCSNCQELLAGRFYYRFKNPRSNEKKKIYCDSCYFRIAPVCYQCLKIINDVSLTYGEKIFHPNCFRCDYCFNSFNGELVFPYNDKNYCSKCYSIIQNDFQPISSLILTLKCLICQKIFHPGDLITKHQIDVKSKKIHYIHNSCLVCNICHVNLSNSIYYSPNMYNEDTDKPTFQCCKCHQVSSNLCSICFYPSDNRMIIFNNQWYHDQCFKCKNCKCQLNTLTRIMIEPDGLSCERCLKSIHDKKLTS